MVGCVVATPASILVVTDVPNATVVTVIVHVRLRLTGPAVGSRNLSRSSSLRRRKSSSKDHQKSVTIT